MRHLAAQFSRFLVIGGISTVLSYAVFFALYRLVHLHYLLASVIGYCAGLGFGFVFNRSWTFNSTNEKKHRELVAYITVYSLSLLGSMIVLKILVEYGRIDPLISNVGAIAFSTVTNFLGCRLFVFRKQ